MEKRPRVLLCVSGSVATVKAPRLAALLAEFAEVRIVKTKASQHFLDRAREYDAAGTAALEATEPPVQVFGDEEEWAAWQRMRDPVLHIQLRDWADVMLVAPLSANTLAKLAAGICDNLLTCVARAWDLPRRKPIVLCPAMNTAMWQHPLTARHLAALQEMAGPALTVVFPVSKLLACGDEGVGALAALPDIVAAVRAALQLPLEAAPTAVPAAAAEGGAASGGGGRPGPANDSADGRPS